MAKVPLKVTSQVAVVRCTGAATHTITMAELASPRQTSLNDPKAAISKIHWTVPSASTASISRNGVQMYDFPAGSWGVFDFHGFNDNEQQDQTVTITITGTASVIVELVKVSGWGDEQTMNQNELG